MEIPVLQVIPQRGPNDCAVACLAMVLGISYEEALVALGLEAPAVLSRGVWRSELQRAAKRLGYRIERCRAWQMGDEDSETTGLLWYSDHMVVLCRGLVVTTDGTIWDAEDFCRYYEREHHELPPTLWTIEQTKKGLI